MKKKLILILCYCFVKAAAAFASINVGMELTNAPFETLSPSGAPIGVSVDIANAFGNWYKQDVIIKNVPFVGLIPSLKSGKIDMILSSMTPTEERKKSIAFSKPYLSIGLCLLISKKSKVESAKDLNSSEYTLVVKTGTTGQQYAKRLFPKATILTIEQESGCITEVLQGNADAFLYDQITVYSTWKKYPEKLKVDLTPLVTESWAAGLRQSDDKLMTAFNNFLKDFEKEDGFKKLSSKYFAQQQKDFEALGVPFIFSPPNTSSP
jgi:polar amino acid transport system substrate-binding protein